MAPAYRVNNKDKRLAGENEKRHENQQDTVAPRTDIPLDFMRSKLEAARAILTELANSSTQHLAIAADEPAPTCKAYTLCLKTLRQLPSTVKRPMYDPASVTPGILHIGTGGFALAHLASYVHDLLAHDKRWGIVATSIRSNRYISALRKQDGMYVLVVRENQTRSASVMAPVVDTIFGPKNPRALYERMAQSTIKLVTLTITNKGYYLADGGKLDLNHPDIVHDLAHPEHPKSVYGYLAAGLAIRRQTIDAPITVMSLDNIEQNSSTMKKVLLEFLERANPELVAWVRDNVDFPVTLVDRITPEPTEAFRNEAHRHMGFTSTLTVGCESFRQLVVERGRFHDTMPAWDKVGVQVVDSCAEYWQRKFYCLNAGHMVVAACGQRLGCKYIHETMRRPAIARLLTHAQREWCTFLTGKPAELDQYAERIRTRFCDASMNDTVRRVGARTTSKLSDRLLSSVERALAATAPSNNNNGGTVIRVPAFILALWLHNLSRTNEQSNAFEAEDAEFDKIFPLYQTAQQLIVSASPDATHVCLDGSREILKSLATMLHEDRFNRLAGLEPFVQMLGWSILAIHRMGLERAAIALLETGAAAAIPGTSPAPGATSPATVKRVASTEPKRDLWKKVHVEGRVRIVRTVVTDGQQVPVA